LQEKCTTLQARGVTIYFEPTVFIIRRIYVFVQWSTFIHICIRLIFDDRHWRSLLPFNPPIDVEGMELDIDMIYLIAIGLTPGGSSTVHIYTQTICRTTHFTN